MENPFVLCLSLEEPQDNNRTLWKIRYTLQAKDDPLLIIPAKRVWNYKKSKVSFLKRKNFDPPGFLLNSLKKAASIYPFIEEELKEGRNETVTLSKEKMCEFIFFYMPLLEKNGIRVILPGHLIKNFPIPQFTGTLRPYQHRGYSWLCFMKEWGLGACLADDMGLGKTLQAILAIKAGIDSGTTKPILVVCPVTLTGNWLREFQKFTPDLSVVIHHGMRRKKGIVFQIQASNHHVVISSYSLLRYDLEVFKQIEWAGIILDEAQNIKNSDTIQAQAAFSMHADHKIVLTGTPVQNNISELWSLMNFLNPGFLGTKEDFLASYGSKYNSERLKNIIKPFILKRLKTDKSIIDDLPEKIEMKIYCNLTKEQANLYKITVKKTFSDLKSVDQNQRSHIILGLLSRLKQICNHPRQYLKDQSKIEERSGKLNRLTEMLEEILSSGEDKILIFTQFVEMGKIIQQHIENIFQQKILFLYGGLSLLQREAIIKKFQNNKEKKILLLSLKTGGVGLNLDQANHVFHYDRWWNPAVENQATDRAYRIGQKKNVYVYKYICLGTLEEKIDTIIEEKKDLVDNLIESGEHWISKLPLKKLKEIFALGKEAIGI